jgi:hypothetical protein
MQEGSGHKGAGCGRRRRGGYLSHRLVVVGVVIASKLESAASLPLVTSEKQQYYGQDERGTSKATYHTSHDLWCLQGRRSTVSIGIRARGGCGSSRSAGSSSRTLTNASVVCCGGRSIRGGTRAAGEDGVCESC